MRRIKVIIKDEVKEALDKGAPVVALESTLIAHGLPYPENLEVARDLENIIREEGAVPATIAVINGEIHIGLTEDELLYIAQSKDVWKLSTREIPICVAQKKVGATTVSATSYLASYVGIKVFSTGGLGGVHRGVSKTWDISRDLEELAKTEIIVVSSGAKSILDLPKTVEYLETKGVIVLG
ncbi:MAG TPA: pseudouridine-5'-phosphate glycosidase, partial [Candidatus Atribacteria bacterium]|nr:pseudouridine-5'-phosphate glycosidase [Candidatus Atribacteria bacterium]